ncbi:hypothetical protein CAC01_14620 [Streptomyces sp. CLI2509]|nr:hypothetical protein CAC01_14620 [Streptomyces sp. CLI2509]
MSHERHPGGGRQSQEPTAGTRTGHWTRTRASAPAKRAPADRHPRRAALPEADRGPCAREVPTGVGGVACHYPERREY